MSFFEAVKARGRDFINGGSYEEDYLDDEQFEADYDMEEEPRRSSRRMRGFETSREFDEPMAQPQKPVSHVLLFKVRKYDDARYIGDQLKNNISVVVNYENVDLNVRIRIQEFVNGVTFAKGGQCDAISEDNVIYSVDRIDVKNSITDVKSAADFAYSKVK